MEAERHSREPKFDDASHTLTLFQPPSPNSKSASSLTVKNKENPLLCEGDESISIQYTFVGETAGTVDLMYLVSIDWEVLKPLQRFHIPEIIITYFWTCSSFSLK